MFIKFVQKFIDFSNPKQYSISIDNLRMATKYSFHVKASGKLGVQKATGRSDLGGNELNSDFEGERIVVPTKGCNYDYNILTSIFLKN